ncbi:hypothetical protein C8R45DRAFT_1111796 [Mycena sanguinolenta]|nr:hypothetical protein C8R45DRAFT_1111796 [Mycena sanguinolenta]
MANGLRSIASLQDGSAQNRQADLNRLFKFVSKAATTKAQVQFVGLVTALILGRINSLEQVTNGPEHLALAQYVDVLSILRNEGTPTEGEVKDAHISVYSQVESALDQIAAIAGPGETALSRFLDSKVNLAPIKMLLDLTNSTDNMHWLKKFTSTCNSSSISLPALLSSTTPSSNVPIVAGQHRYSLAQ